MYMINVLDLKQKVDRKTEEVECMVHYKTTHTNINVKERSNHPSCMKKGIIKGFADRARVLVCGQWAGRNKMKEYMTPDQEKETKEPTKLKEECRGVVSIPYVRGLSEQFMRIAMKHRFRTASKPGRKVKEIKSPRSQKPCVQNTIQM
jgi:hypothetical protein